MMQMVPQMMGQAAKDYGAGYLTELKLLHFDLGKVNFPPLLRLFCIFSVIFWIFCGFFWRCKCDIGMHVSVVSNGV